MMPGKKLAGVKDRVAVILPLLEKLYPEAKCALDHRNAFELLVATILSAQCTDVRVNMVTPVLFKKYPTPEAMARATQEEVEGIIKSTGFFRNKAKAIREASGDIVGKFGGKVPETMEGLTSLRGVGRKTANVVLGNAFGQNVGVVVDTHVGRLAGRLGWTKETAPEKVELDLMKLVPREQWTMLAHWLIFHGRKACAARKPKCEECGVREWCPRVGVGK
jgi:endonuclease III